jgi:hypothetical protein
MKQQKEIKDSSSRPGVAALLQNMRGMKDVSSFVIEGGEQDGGRIPVSDDEVPIGWNQSGGRLAWDRSEIDAPCLSVFKDWCGIEVEPAGGRSLFINGRATTQRVRLRHGDRLKLQAIEAKGADIHLLFQEPISLSILDSLFSQESPQDAPADAPVIEQSRGESSENDRSEQPPPVSNRSDRPAIAETLRGNKKYPNYFSSTEIWLVILCTPILTLLLLLALLVITKVIE